LNTDFNRTDILGGNLTKEEHVRDYDEPAHEHVAEQIKQEVNDEEQHQTAAREYAHGRGIVAHA